MKNVLISNIMMIKEKDRFDQEVRALGYNPIWANPKQFLSEQECLELVGDIDGWLAGDDQITRAVFDKAAPRLEVIAKWGTGIDSIDHAAATDFRVPVLNSPGAFANTVAEVAIHFMLSLCRNLVAIDREVQKGYWPKPQGVELGSAIVGIIGFGAIGRRIGDLASCFGAAIHYADPFVQSPVKLTGGEAKAANLDELAETCDIICLASNYSAENHHMVDAGFFEKMKPNAFLVNVARGPLVDEQALVQALDTGKIAGAGLDVFEVEPLPEQSSLRNRNNVILGSHNANNSLRAVEYVHANTLKNLISVLG